MRVQLDPDTPILEERVKSRKMRLLDGKAVFVPRSVIIGFDGPSCLLVQGWWAREHCADLGINVPGKSERGNTVADMSCMRPRKRRR